MAFSMRIVVDFKMAFPDEKPKSIEKYLEGISREMPLKVSPFFLGFNTAKSEYGNIARFLEMFFSEGNTELAQKIYENITFYIHQAGHKIQQYEIPSINV